MGKASSTADELILRIQNGHNSMQKDTYDLHSLIISSSVKVQESTYSSGTIRPMILTASGLSK